METDFQIFLGQKIKNARNQMGFSQKQLGEIIGITQQGVSFYEQGIRPIRIDLLISIAEACNVPMRFFFFETTKTDELLSVLDELPPDIREVGFEMIQSLAKLKNHQKVQLLEKTPE